MKIKDVTPAMVEEARKRRQEIRLAGVKRRVKRRNKRFEWETDDLIFHDFEGEPKAKKNE